MHAITASRMYCGVVGGSLIRCVLKDGDDLEIRPGLQIQAGTADSSLGHSIVPSITKEIS